jgi:flavorubredoxin
MLPTVSAFLTYIKGLKPQKRIGLAFGSYGWGGQGAKEVAEAMKNMGWEMPLDLINIQYLPGDNELDMARDAGKRLGEIIQAQ